MRTPMTMTPLMTKHEHPFPEKRELPVYLDPHHVATLAFNQCGEQGHGWGLEAPMTVDAQGYGIVKLDEGFYGETVFEALDAIYASILLQSPELMYSQFGRLGYDDEHMVGFRYITASGDLAELDALCTLRLDSALHHWVTDAESTCNLEPPRGSTGWRRVTIRCDMWGRDKTQAAALVRAYAIGSLDVQSHAERDRRAERGIGIVDDARDMPLSEAEPTIREALKRLARAVEYAEEAMDGEEAKQLSCCAKCVNALRDSKRELALVENYAPHAGLPRTEIADIHRKIERALETGEERLEGLNYSSLVQLDQAVRTLDALPAIAANRRDHPCR